MLQYRLLVLDLDGTLTNSQKIITPKTLKALFRAQEAGVKIVLASGRPTFGIEPIAKQMQLKKNGGYILSYNGGQIIDYQTGETLFQQSLPANEIPHLYEFAKKHNLAIMSYDGNDIVTENPEDEYVIIEAKINNMPIRGVESFLATIQHPVTKCLIVGEPTRLAEVEKIAKQEFGSNINLFTSAPYFLECVPPGIDKALSIDRLIKKLKLTKENVVACGDGYNDLSMIQFAGLGVAMGNAQNGVLEAADFITLSNDEDGVAYVINNYIFHRNKLRRMFNRDYWKLKWQNKKRKK